MLLNLFQHLIVLKDQTLNQPMKQVQGMVQGDKKIILTKIFFLVTCIDR